MYLIGTSCLNIFFFQKLPIFERSYGIFSLVVAEHGPWFELEEEFIFFGAHAVAHFEVADLANAFEGLVAFGANIVADCFLAPAALQLSACPQFGQSVGGSFFSFAKVAQWTVALVFGVISPVLHMWQ